MEQYIPILAYTLKPEKNYFHILTIAMLLY